MSIYLKNFSREFRMNFKIYISHNLYNHSSLLDITHIFFKTFKVTESWGCGFLNCPCETYLILMSFQTNKSFP